MAEDTKELNIDYREVGATGLKRFSGFIFEEFLLELTGWKGVRVFKEMSNNDPTIGAVLFAMKMLIRKVPWRVKSASPEMVDEEAAEFLETCMNDMSQSWIDTIDEILSMLTYGYSVHEIVYKRRCGDSLDPSMRSKYSDGRIGWRKLPIRSQDTIYRWQFDDNGGIQGVEQLAPPHYNQVAIPVEKMLLFRTTIEKNNPEGKSIFRNAYRPWYLKKNIENIEGVGVERDLAGLPVALVPPELLSSGASTSQKNLLSAIRTIVTNIRRDEQEGIVFPQAYDSMGKELYSLKLLSTGGSRQFDTDKIIQRYDMRIAMTALADFMLIGQQNVGSFAMVSSKTNLFSAGISGILDILCGIFNRYGVPRLFGLNDFMVTSYPEVVHGDVESVDLKELGDYITKLAQAGAPLFPDAELENYVRKVANLPELPEEKARLSMQVTAPRETPQKINEITSGDSANGPSDTTPINPKPPVSRVITNVTGTTEENSSQTEQETGEQIRNQRRFVT